MKKEKLTVQFIEMYCRMVDKKFQRRIQASYDNDYRRREEHSKKMGKKLGADKLQKEVNELHKKLNEINDIIRVDYNKNSLTVKLEKERDEIQTKIRMSSCPEEIKEILNKIKD